MPEGTARIDEHVIPEEALAPAARRRAPIGMLLRDAAEVLRDKVPRVPILSRAPIRDARQCAPAGRTPVGCQDRLPNDEHAEIRV